MNDWFIGAANVGALTLAFCFGWIAAHGTVKTECQKLGSFYVSNTVFECKEKK